MKIKMNSIVLLCLKYSKLKLTVEGTTVKPQLKNLFQTDEAKRNLRGRTRKNRSLHAYLKQLLSYMGRVRNNATGNSLFDLLWYDTLPTRNNLCTTVDLTCKKLQIEVVKIPSFGNIQTWIWIGRLLVAYIQKCVVTENVRFELCREGDGESTGGRCCKQQQALSTSVQGNV